MKTTYEKSIEYAEINDDKHCNLSKNFDKFDIAQSFEAGAEFAQRWIRVEDELPNAEGEANRLSEVVIAKCEDLADEVSAYYDTITQDWRIYPSGQIIKTTHWRPIELK